MPPRASHDHGGASAAGGGRKRYAATVMKGDNAWRSEWGSFMSGINLKRVRDGTSGVALRSSQDLAQYADNTYPSDEEDVDNARIDNNRHHNDDEDDDMGGAVATYAYLFNSPAERRAEREAKQKAHEEEVRRRRKERSGNPLDLLSKHQRSLVEAQERGLALDGMTRKEKREFLHLTVSKEQKEAVEHAKAFKLHDLMDEKIAWYQQGPHPIDLIAEKLVSRKADKKAKQLSLKYNYLRPHPSWMAKRAQHRRERLLVGLGRRFIFDESGQAMDPLRNNAPVDLTKVSWLLVDRQTPTHAAEPAVEQQQQEEQDADEEQEETTSAAEGAEVNEEVKQEERTEAQPSSSSSAPAPAQPTRPQSSVLTNILVDPLAAQNHYVRSVVRDREAALALQKANLSTTFLSSRLVRDPREAPPGARDDADEEEGGASASSAAGGRGRGRGGQARGGRGAVGKAGRTSAGSNVKRGPSFAASREASEVKKWEKKLANKAKKMD